MDKTLKSPRGGSRPGAGRPKGESTKVIRLPLSLVPAVQSLLAAPDGTLLPSPHPAPLKRPLFGHKVRAGFPSPADDFVEAWLDLNEHLIEHRDATFFLQASGDSMVGAGIQEGNLLVVDRALEAADGDLVVAMVDGTLALKRLSRRNGHVRLLPENPCHRPDALADDPELSVWGVATSVVHSLRR